MKRSEESTHLWTRERKYHKCKAVEFFHSCNFQFPQWSSTKEMPAAHHSLQGATMHSYCTDFLHSLTDNFSVTLTYFHLFPPHLDKFVAHIPLNVHNAVD